MIKKIIKENIPECVEVIRSSFFSVANEFGFTEENAPRFTAFATTNERLIWQLEEGRLMFAYLNDDEKILGYYSLQLQGNRECELNNLCVLSEYRHKNIGKELMEHAFSYAKQLGCKQMNIGIVEENVKLKQWYIQYGAEHLRTEKYDFFPFTCGYMKKTL
ncbi:MAG TPA: GNAT family N-acetyltransferase [Lachnospiraceae bacterium]|nr:GNAT family N-acetyltransferase [Lachnospiraceae bacterium]